MKLKIFATIAFCCVAFVCNAQFKIHSNGNISINTTSTPLSQISINSAGVADHCFYLTGTKNGVYSRTTGAGYNWGYAGDFENSGFTSNFIVGVKGAILSSTEYNNGRSFGIMGVGGYATNGWNYGVFGRLQGSKYGAGVYGTSNPTDNGTYVDGKYAGYFNGNTKV